MDTVKTCDACGQALPEPKNVWMTAEQVKRAFGIDPTAEKYEGKIKNKLVNRISGDGTNYMQRLYLKASVEYL